MRLLDLDAIHFDPNRKKQLHGRLLSQRRCLQHSFTEIVLLLGVYFAAVNPADRDILAPIVAEAEDLIASPALNELNAVAVDFLDPTATAAFRDRIAASLMT